jgi:hypothetical protein
MTDEHVTRRRALKGVAGLAVAGGLAGCTGSDGSESTGATAESGSDDGSEATTTTTTTGPPADGGEAATETDDTEETETTEATSDESATRTLTFPSSAGDEVTATRWGDGDCAAVFLHGVGYGREDWAPQATAVAESGHTALALALNHDDRESNVEATVGAVDYLKSERGVETVVLVGASAGANAVVKTDANTDLDVAGSFILAPGRAADLGAGLSGRKLFAVGEGDSQRFVETTERLHSDAPEPKELVMLDASEHAQGIFDTDAGERLQSLVVEFVNTVCAEA